MHFVLCRLLRILEDMSFLSFLRILIQLEEPSHLTADNALYACACQESQFRFNQGKLRAGGSKSQTMPGETA